MSAYLIPRARAFAIAAHAAVGHTRKYTLEPYHVHLEEVAHIVHGVGGSEEMIAAAWLHDTVEDTGVTPPLIDTEFGALVGVYVHWLTDISTPAMGNRAARKIADRDHIAGAPAAVHTIKLADSISNVRSIIVHDEAFARVYVPEKRELWEVLTRGDAGLRAELKELLDGRP